MKEYISQQDKIKLQILGVYQILGGLAGVIFNVWALFTQLPFFGIQIIFPFLFFILYAYSIFCGRKCLYLDESALTYSLYNQMLQMLGLSMLGFVFRYTAGFSLNIIFDFTNSIALSFQIGFPSFAFFYNRDPHITKMNFNLIAIVLIFVIDKLMRLIKRKKEIHYAMKN